MGKIRPDSRNTSRKPPRATACMRRRLARNRRADHGSERRHAERVENGGDEKRRGIAGEAQAEIGEQQHQHEQAFGECHDHERENLAQQKFVRRNAGDVDLQDGFLLAFLGHGQRGQQRREHGDSQHEDSRPVESSSTSGPGCTKAGSRPARAARGVAPAVRCVIGAGDLAGIARHELGRVGVGGVHQNLHRRVVPRAMSRPKCCRDDQRARAPRWK